MIRVTPTTNDLDPHDITLAILAGGAGSRMGGPKGSLQIHGKPILMYLLERFAWTGPTMLVLAPGAQSFDGAEKFGHVVSDPIAGLGPLRGVLTTLENSKTEITIVATVDMPGIGFEQLLWVAGQLEKHPEAHGVMSVRSAGQIEPFPCSFRAPARQIIEQELQRGRRSVHGLLKLGSIMQVNAPTEWPPVTWTNLNSPQDLRAFNEGSSR